MSNFAIPWIRHGWLIGALLCVGMHAVAAEKEPSDADCPMRAPPIERKQLLVQPGVMSVTLSKDRLRAAVLLKDGYAIQIYHTGCEHVGFDATRWVDELPKTPEMKLKAIRQLIKTALQDPHLKEVSMTSNDFNVQLDGSRILYSHTQENLYAEFTHQTNGRYLLSVTYALPY